MIMFGVRMQLNMQGPDEKLCPTISQFTNLYKNSFFNCSKLTNNLMEFQKKILKKNSVMKSRFINAAKRHF